MSQDSNWEKRWKSPLKCQKDLKEISFIMNEQRNTIGINVSRGIHYDQRCWWLSGSKVNTICRASDGTQSLNPCQSITRVSPEKQILLKVFSEPLISEQILKWKEGCGGIALLLKSTLCQDLEEPVTQYVITPIDVFKELVLRAHPLTPHKPADALSLFSKSTCIFSKSTEGFEALLKMSIIYTKVWIFI